jgi:hypothetical protein
MMGGLAVLKQQSLPSDPPGRLSCQLLFKITISSSLSFLRSSPFLWQAS